MGVVNCSKGKWSSLKKGTGQVLKGEWSCLEKGNGHVLKKEVVMGDIILSHMFIGIATIGS